MLTGELAVGFVEFDGAGAQAGVGVGDEWLVEGDVFFGVAQFRWEGKPKVVATVLFKP